jgi:hypothetical protein
VKEINPINTGCKEFMSLFFDINFSRCLDADNPSVKGIEKKTFFIPNKG